MLFYVGLDQPSLAHHFEHAFISINRLRTRKSDFACQKWIMDSGAFTEISRHGEYREPPEVYAAQIERWRTVGGFEMAVCQDYMCEPFILEKTGLTIYEHQRRTIARFLRIQAATQAYVMPVLQGFALADYLQHLRMWQDVGAVREGARVGVGSVCKRNKNIREIEDLILALGEAARGLRLHGFGVKTTALASEWVWRSLYSADSMAWSYSARKQGRNGHCWTEAKAFEQKILTRMRTQKPIQLSFLS